MDDGQEFFSEDEDFWQDWKEYEEDAQVDEKNEYLRTICYYCDRGFTSVKKRFQHEKICNYGSTERFTCKVCKLNFRLEQGLERHKKRHDLPGGFSCLSCEEKFTESSQRLQHNITVHKSFNCQICKSTFSSQDDYVDHIIRNHSKCKCWLLEQKDDQEEAKYFLRCKTCCYVMKSLSDGLMENHKYKKPPDVTNTKAGSTLDKVEIDSDDLGMNGDNEQMSSSRKSSENQFLDNFLQDDSDDEFPDIDDDMPLAQLKSQMKKPSSTRKSPRKSKKETVKEDQYSDESEGVDFFDMSSMMENASNLEVNNESEEEEISLNSTRGRSTSGEPQVDRTPDFKCPYCPQMYMFEKRYVKHLKTAHGVEPDPGFTAKNKREAFKANFILGYRKHGCTKCKRRFATKASLKKHEQCHGDDGKLRVKCTLCEEMFDDESLIKEHKKSAHKDEVTCTFCKKTYAGEKNLQNHIELRHTKTRELKKMVYLCGKCGKNFTSKTALMDHERSDCGKSPIYQCDICKKYYHSAGSLKGHKSLHTKEKPFVCKFCGKTFRNAGQLRVHERIHTGEKPHKCTYCPKAFSHRETLLTHLTVHTGFKRFMCSGCGKRFACISNLQVHRKAHSNTCGLVPNCTKAMGPMASVLPPEDE
ncbi:uncharacterized protein DMENIID0001_034410 [Sergentomyia squamirostris]